MNFIKQHLTNILLVTIAVMLILMYVRKPAQVKDNTAELIAAKDETIRVIQHERDTYREWKDSAVAALTRKNDVLVKEYKTYVTKYEKIPANINSLSADSLVRAAIEY